MYHAPALIYLHSPLTVPNAHASVARAATGRACPARQSQVHRPAQLARAGPPSNLGWPRPPTPRPFPARPFAAAPGNVICPAPPPRPAPGLRSRCAALLTVARRRQNVSDAARRGAASDSGGRWPAAGTLPRLGSPRQPLGRGPARWLPRPRGGRRSRGCGLQAGRASPAEQPAARGGRAIAEEAGRAGASRSLETPPPSPASTWIPPLLAFP